MRPARVVSVGRNSAWIAFEDESELRLAALRKTLARETLAPGDLVLARPLEDERVIVESREPRTFALQRTTAGGRTKTMAANVDGIAIVAAFERPALHLAMIDELLAFTELHELGARLVFTKPDLAAPGDVDRVLALYGGLGYAASAVNPKAGEGVATLERDFAGRHTLLIGQSGVGKSTLFRALGGSAVIGDVSKIGRGRQTTTVGRLHRFPEGFLIDSPGVGEFELAGEPPPVIASGFREFAPLVRSCRFADCTHRTEPQCAVRAASESGAVARSRYESYLAILQRQGQGAASVQPT
jgi:ribosome biogenesis GTPase